MTDFEQIICAMLIVVYGVVFYLAGKGDLLTLIPKMLLDKAKELEEKMKEDEREK